MATVVTDLLDLLSQRLGVHKHLYLHLAGLLVMGHEPRFWWETGLALIVQAGFATTLGIIFAYLLPLMGYESHLLKGWMYGVGTWFLVYAVATMSRTPAGQSWGTAISHFTTSSIFGLLLAVFLRRSERR